jgi:hypothetical protein
MAAMPVAPFVAAAPGEDGSGTRAPSSSGGRAARRVVIVHCRGTWAAGMPSGPLLVLGRWLRVMAQLASASHALGRRGDQVDRPGWGVERPPPPYGVPREEPADITSHTLRKVVYGDAGGFDSVRAWELHLPSFGVAGASGHCLRDRRCCRGSSAWHCHQSLPWSMLAPGGGLS